MEYLTRVWRIDHPEGNKEVTPTYDYIYLGDNARTPYGTRSFDVVFEYTLEAVKKLFELNCELTILACNTASAKALRNIQQNILPEIAPEKRVLGVIRPRVEEVLNIPATSIWSVGNQRHSFVGIVSHRTRENIKRRTCCNSGSLSNVGTYCRKQ
jgi:glutamate racemase